MTQSSIEWLFEQYKLVGMLTTAQVEKAKAMHKEEIKNSLQNFLDVTLEDEILEEYYNETFNNKEK